MTGMLLVFGGVVLAFFALAKLNARPGFNAFALGLCLAITPQFARAVPGPTGDWRNVEAIFGLLVAASLGTALGGGLKPREGHDHDHDHGEPHHH